MTYSKEELMIAQHLVAQLYLLKITCYFSIPPISSLDNRTVALVVLR